MSRVAGGEAEAQKGWEIGQVKVIAQKRAQDSVTVQNACPSPSASVITHFTTFSASAHNFLAHEIHMILFLSNKHLGPPVLCLILLFFQSHWTINYLCRVEAHPSRGQALHAQHLGGDKPH